MDWYADNSVAGFAEEAPPVEEAASEPPATPATEPPTSAPQTEPDSTQAPEAEPTPAPQPVIASEVAPIETTLAQEDTAKAVPSHPYLLLELCDGGLTVTGLGRTEADILIPSNIDGVPLVSIAKEAMKGEVQLEKVTIEDGLISIGKQAFKDCVALTTVELPASITDIASDAFGGCTALTVLQAPEDCYAYDFAAAWLLQQANVNNQPTPAQPLQSVEPIQSEQPADIDDNDSSALLPQAQPITDTEQPNDAGQITELTDKGTLPDTDPDASLLINGNTVIGVGKSTGFTATVQSSLYTAKDTILWSLGSTTAATLKTVGNIATITAVAASAEPVALTASLQKDSSITATVYLSILSLASKVTVTSETGRTVLDINVPSDHVQLSAHVAPDKASQAVIWTSSNPAVAAVDGNGIVTAGGKTGTAVISATATDGSKKTGTYPITVSKALTNIAVSGSASVGIGKTVKPTILFTPMDATNKALVWTSSNAKVATVSSTGVVKGITVGEATITAMSKENPSLTAEWLLNVAPAVTKMTLSGGGIIDLSAEPPHERQLTLTVEPATAVASIVWSSSKPSVATVDATGLVTATGAAGTTTIKASATDGSGKSTSTTVAVTYKPTGIQITGSTALVAGKSTTLRASVTPAAASQTVTWESSDKTVATVDSKGVVKANAKASNGTLFTITARSVADKNCTASVEMTVTKPVANFTIEGADTLDMATDTTLALTAETIDGHTPVPVLWTISSTKVATIDASGIITPISAGTSTITATAADGSGKKATKLIQVISLVESIRSATSPDITLALGKTYKLDASAMPTTALAADRVLRWESSDPATVAVSAGTLKALKLTQEGEPVLIKATAAGLSSAGDAVTYNFSVTVMPMATKITITPEPNQNYINLNSELKALPLSVTVLPAEACQTVLWQSSNEAVASVDENGLVTGLAAGKVAITAITQDASQKKATLSLTVFSGAESIAITGAESICGGLSTTYVATVLPRNVSQSVVWSIQADTVPVTVGGKATQQPVASISSTGVVKTIPVPEKKQAIITVRSKDDPSISSTFTLAVLPVSTRVSINAARKWVSTNPASALQLTAYVEPAEAAQSVTWRSSDTAVAMVSESGLVTGKSKGYVIITATATDGSNACAHKWIGVGESVQALEIVGPNDMGTGTETDLTVVTTPSEVAIADVVWESSDENLATVDAQGHVIIADSIESSLETVTITVTSVENPAVSDVLTITVRPAAIGIVLAPSTTQYIDFTAGEGSLQLSAAVEPEGALQSLEWMSSDESVATVDNSGLITAHKFGVSTITAKALDSSDVQASLSVHVVIPVTQVMIAPVDHLIAGDTHLLETTVAPANASEPEILWEVTQGAAVSSITPEGLLSVLDITARTVITVRASACSNPALSDTISITVYPKTTAVAIVEASAYIDVDNVPELTLHAALTPADAYPALAWESDDSHIVCVNDMGMVTGLKAGVTIVRAETMDGTALSCGIEVHVEKNDYAYSIIPGGLRLTAYAGDAAQVEIPAAMMGQHVISLADDLFSNNETITEITIPAGVPAVSNRCFYQCTNLAKLTLPASVETIGEDAFYGCTALREIAYAD